MAGGCRFEEVYEAYRRIYEAQYENLAKVYEIDKHEVQAGYEDTLLNVLEEYSPVKGVFTHYLKRSLRNRLTDILRAEFSRQSREMIQSLIVDDEERSVFYVIQSSENVEEKVLDERIGDKQVTLIAELVNAANVDQAMENVLRGIMAGNSVHRAAKLNGICHKTVRRRLDRIAGIYNRNKHGDIQDYFTA